MNKDFEDFLNKKNKEVTVSESIAKQSMSISSYWITVLKFFSDKKTRSQEYSLTFYNSVKIQNCINEYMDSIGFTLSEISNFNSTYGIFDLPPKSREVEIGVDKKLNVIIQGLYVYENNLKEKIIISIDKDYDGSSRDSYLFYIFSLDSEKKFSWDDLKKLSNKMNPFIGKKINANLDFLQIDNISWDSIIIPEESKEIIKTNVNEFFDNSEIFKKLDIKIKRGLILSGPPGTGKTMCCKAIINETNKSVIYVQPAHIRTPGDISNICNIAKEISPTILIIEDIDWIASDRSSGMGDLTIQLMTELDGIESFDNIITIGTTNHSEKLETAIKNRPGRFDRIIKIDNPNKECSLKMIKTFFSNVILDFEVNASIYDDIINSGKKNRLSGAHIKDMCLTSIMLAIKDKSLNSESVPVVKKIHLEKSLNEIKDKDFSSYFEEKSNIGFSTRQSVGGLSRFD